MLVDFTGQLALVTGGTRGIGAAIVKELAASGASVVATGRDPAGIATLKASPKQASLSVRYEAVDFADPDATEAFAARMAGEPFSVLVNNAGINKIARTGDVDMTDWDRIQQVNVRAPMVLCRTLAPRMAGRGYGRIVNITSIWSQVSRSQRISYSTSKTALVGLTRALALDYAASNVLANGVAPGVINTELTRRVLSEKENRELVAAIPVGRLGTEDEIARVVAFLASSSNTFITGQNIVADGGFTCG
jgi:NAD(P)-dependent dehydrogenase (short-subunit alcohol dehydrogenase family)